MSRIQKKKIRRQNKESKIRKRVRNFITFVIFILLIALFLYPAVSNSWNQYRSEKLQTKYEKTVSRDPKKEAIYKKARAYNKRHTENIITKYSVLPQDLTNREYSSYLHVPATRMMGMIFIPKIDVKLPIYHGTGEYALSNGCGHVKGTSLPVGGKSSNCVLTAHRGLPSAKLFTDLNRMKNGDVFYIETVGHTLTYHVDSVRTVKPSHLESLKISKGKDYVTLMTCTPYGVNTERLLVRGHRVKTPSKAYREIEKGTVINDTLLIRFLIAILMLLIYIILSLREAVRDEDEKKKNIHRRKK